MKKSLLLLSLSLCVSAIYAQHKVSSFVYDASNSEPLEGATVRLLNAADSTLIDGAMTDEMGAFALQNVNSGNYLLEISFFGFKTIYQKIEVKEENLTLKPFPLEDDMKMLNELVVVGKAAQMTIKGDTIEFNAAAFKLGENAVVEDLLKKLPGVEITTEGKILVNGQEVTKIRVDGKKFFEGDVEMATKNIPADLIDKVQVLEQKSEMAQLTGFEDDDTERIINLTFKESKKKGMFGNVGGGLGADIKKNPNLRYDANGFLNFINNNTQTAITANANNLNNSRSTRGRGSRGGSGDNGITSSQNIGVTNSTYINEKLTLGGDLMFSHSRNDAVTNAVKENFSSFKDSTTTKSLSDIYAINGRFELEYKKDSFNTFIFQPNVSYTYSTSIQNEDFLITLDNDTTSSGFTNNNKSENNLNGSFVFMYNYKSPKRKGRSFTTRLNGGVTVSDVTDYNFWQRETDLDTIKQKSFQENQRYSTDLRLSYVEPLWNTRNLLEIVAGARFNHTNSDKNQYDFDPVKNDYDYTTPNNDYSNKMTNNFWSETFELNYRLMQQKYNLTVGFLVEPSQTKNTVAYGNDLFRDTAYQVINYAPTARFQYNFGKKHTFRINYRGRTTQPSINQLQPVRNNSNLMSETIGNPSLNPSFSHNIAANYSKLFEKSLSTLTLDFRATATQNAIVSNSVFDPSGKRYNQSVNAMKTDIPYNLNLGIMYNVAVFKRKLNINTTTRGSFAKIYGYSLREPSMVDVDNLELGQRSATNNASFQEMLSFSYSHDIFDVGTRGILRYTNTYNNLTNINTDIFDWTVSGNFVLRMPKNFTFSTDVNYNIRSGYANFDRNEIILNASLDKGFLKNQLVLSVKVFDILQQRQNIRQVIGDTYIQYTENENRLQSYFLVTLTYKISKFAGMTTAEAEQGSQQQRRGGGARGERPSRM